MAPGPGSFATPHPGHAGIPGAPKAQWWVAAPVPAEPVGCRPSQACNPPLRVGTHRRRWKINMEGYIANETRRGGGGVKVGLGGGAVAKPRPKIQKERLYYLGIMSRIIRLKLGLDF